MEELVRLKRIHINQHNIKWNKKNPTELKPVVTVKCGGKTYIGQDVSILGESQIIYRPNKPLSCGAHVWIETKSDIEIDGVLLS